MRLGAWIVTRSAEGCWVWSRAKNAHGYGNFRSRPAHRLTYELFRGAIPEGFDLHHRCGNRACVNPWHLTAIQHDVHASVDSANGRKEFCAQGHPFASDNLYVDPRGRRHCRTCRREVNRRWQERQSALRGHHGDVPQPVHLVKTDADLVDEMLANTTPLESA